MFRKEGKQNVQNVLRGEMQLMKGPRRNAGLGVERSGLRDVQSDVAVQGRLSLMDP